MYKNVIKFLNELITAPNEKTEEYFYLQSIYDLDIKSIFNTYVQCKLKLAKVLDTIFVSKEEGKTISIDEFLDRNYQLLVNIILRIESTKQVKRNFDITESTRALSKLHQDHEYLSRNWLILRTEFINESNEIKKRFNIKDNEFIWSKFLKGLLQEIDEDLERDSKFLTNESEPIGIYEVFYDFNVRNIIINSTTGKSYVLYTRRFNIQINSIFVYIFHNPNKVNTIDESKNISGINFKSGTHQFLNNIRTPRRY